MLQSVKHPALGFGSGYDLAAVGSSPASGSVLSMKSVLDYLSFSLPLSLSLSLSNK